MALAEPHRRRILEMLAEQGQLSASAIASRFRVSPPAISQHLKVLREARLVRMEKHAQQRLYEINPEAMHELEGWARRMAQQYDEQYDRLERLVKAQEEAATNLRSRKESTNGRSTRARERSRRGKDDPAR